MTMLGYADGTSHEDGASYFELAEFLMRNGAAPDADLEQLWRRIVYSVAISNCDDHLRNHGFILTPIGWRLSPAYDLNPVAHGRGLKLNISESDNALDFDLVQSVAPRFRVKNEKANAIMQQVKTVVSDWRKSAISNSISHAEIERMASAFRVPQ
jgi:serine/threonine-protein kinase HipA